MTKLTYAQQLLHPNWQKKRLEILSLKNFQCEICEDKDSTLHVHHKAYKKGSMAWEYENSNFMCLCKDCHDFTHQEKECLNSVIESISPTQYMEAAALLHAFFNQEVHDGFYTFTPFTYEAGEIARSIAETKLNINDVKMLKEKLQLIDSKVIAHIEFVKDYGVSHGAF